MIIGHVPAGASWKQFIHFGQGYINPGKKFERNLKKQINFWLNTKFFKYYFSGTFRHFDYGDNKINLKMYGSSLPPAYGLEKVTSPVALFSSANDWLATPRVRKMKNIIFNSILNSIFNIN